MTDYYDEDEERQDAADAEAALAEGDPIPAEDVWAGLGLADEDAEDVRNAEAVLAAIKAGAPTVPHEEIVRRYC